MKSTHICFYTNYVPRLGGVETAIFEVSKGLGELGYKITIAFESAEEQKRLFHYSQVADLVRVAPNDKDFHCDICIIGSNHLTPKKIRAKKYVQWIHADYEENQCGLRMNEEVKEYVAVSEHAAKVARRLFGVKVTPILNFLHPDWTDYKVLRLVTASRVSEEKGFDRMYRLCELLEENKINYHWEVLGDNSIYPRQYTEVLEKFERFPKVRFRGFMEDIREPLTRSDYLVQLSDREGCPYCVIEAIAFGVPCLVTDWNGSNELVKEGKNGYIIPKDMKISKKRLNDMVTKIPKFKGYNISEIKQWEKVLGLK